MLRRAGLLALIALSSSTEAQPAKPVVDHNPITRFTRGQAPNIQARIYSPSGRKIFEATVFIRSSSIQTFTRIELSPVRGTTDLYLAAVPEAFVQDDFAYFIEAFDADGNGPARSGEPTRPHRVKAEAPSSPVVERAAQPAPASSGKPEATPPSPEPNPSPPVATTSLAPSRRTVGLVTAGAGVVLMAAGGTSGALALQSYQAEQRASASGDEPTYSRTKRDAKSQALIADVLLASGALVAIVGGYLFFSAQPDSAAPHASIVVGPEGAFALVTGRF